MWDNTKHQLAPVPCFIEFVSINVCITQYTVFSYCTLYRITNMKDYLSGCVKNDLNLSIGVRMAHDAATTRNIMYMI